MLEVSVVLPVYNCKRYIADAISSILSQKFDSFELIVVNDGSTDGTTEILNDFKHQKLRIFTNTENKGLVYSLNLAINNAIGKYICRMDADDIATTNRLQVQYNYLEHNKNISCVGCQGYNINEKGLVIGKTIWRRNTFMLKFFMLIGNNPVGHPFAMIKKEAITDVGGYREEYFGAEDIDLWLRILKNGGLFANCPEYLMKYRLHESQITMNTTKINSAKFFVMYSFYKQIGIKDEGIGETLELFLDVKNYKVSNYLLCIKLFKEITTHCNFSKLSELAFQLIYIFFFSLNCCRYYLKNYKIGFYGN